MLPVNDFLLTFFISTCRENTAYWKVKDINSTEQRTKGYCPLTPKEIGIFLTALGFPSNTPIYIAAGEIYGGDSRMADLQSRYPLLMNKVCCESPTCLMIIFISLVEFTKNLLTSGAIIQLWENSLVCFGIKEKHIVWMVA